MEAMFSGATSFDQNIAQWDVGSVTTTQEMFYNAASFNRPLNDWSPKSSHEYDGHVRRSYILQPGPQ